MILIIIIILCFFEIFAHFHIFDVERLPPGLKCLGFWSLALLSGCLSAFLNSSPVPDAKFPSQSI